MDLARVVVSSNENEVFYKVIGDEKKYLDLDSVLYNHQELASYLGRNRYDLLHSFHQKSAMVDGR